MKRIYFALLLSIILLFLCHTAYATENVDSYVEYLLEQKKYREAIIAYRRLCTPESLSKSYELEAEYFWGHDALSIDGARYYKFPTVRSDGDALTLCLKNQSGDAFVFDIVESKKENEFFSLHKKFDQNNTPIQMLISSYSAVGPYIIYPDNGRIIKNGSFSDRYDEFIPIDQKIVKIQYPYVLKADGTVESLDEKYSAPIWRDIIDISCGGILHGLRNDGTLLAYIDGETVTCNDEWSNLYKIDNGDGSGLIGYRYDGSVIASPNTQSLTSKMLGRQDYSEEIPEMHGLRNVEFYRIGSRDPDTGEDIDEFLWHFFGIDDNGTLISTYSGCPLIENVVDFELQYSSATQKVGTTKNKSGIGGCTIFCLHSDGSIARYAIKGIDTTIKKELSPLISDQAIEKINQIIHSVTSNPDL